MGLCGDKGLHRRQLYLHTRKKEMRLQAIFVRGSFERRISTKDLTLLAVKWTVIYKGYKFLSFVHLLIRQILNNNKWNSNFK
jgi:hypothetical protein